MDPFTYNDVVETSFGVGRIVEIRLTPSGIVVLVEFQPGGLGRGYSEVFSPEEIIKIVEKETK